MLPTPTVEMCALPRLDAVQMAEPYTILLQSAVGNPLSRWSLFAQRPWQVAIVRGTTVELHRATGVETLVGDPWRVMAQLMDPWRQDAHPLHPCPGGVLGFMGYDAARTLVPLPEQPDDLGLPDALLAWYAEIVAWQPGATHAWRGTLGHSVGPPVAPPLDLPAPPSVSWSVALDRAGYVERVQQVLEYIAAGDIYQANLTFHMRGHSSATPWEVFQRLCERTAAPFGAYLSFPDMTILSASPERFLHCTSTGKVETRPIKGTRPRGATPAADANLAHELYTNEKERAENLMITDLLRNDLGQVCEIGSVRVPTLWEVVSLPTVHHLVSTVTGQLKPGVSGWELLRACWPGGSITGAPKRRAMQIIAELETQRRGVYCGSIGYWSFDGSLDTSIVIRTMIERQGVYTWGVGCGIVADSNPDAEYDEALLKGAALAAAVHRRSEA